MLRKSGLFLAVAAGIALYGCASTPPPTAPTAVFYPAPPEPPRIQHLLTLASERDLGEPDSALSKFVLGEDKSGRELKQPYGVAPYDGKLYVADSKGPGLVVFDLVNRKYSQITGAGAGRMQRPINVTIDTDGTKYVTDTGRNQVLVFDRNEQFVRALGDEKQFKPVDTAIAGDRLYVVDIEHHEVQVLDKRSGKLLFKFGKPGSGEGEMFQPTNLAIGANGDIFVTETGNFRVQRFTSEGKPVRVFGEVGNLPGQFARPKGIAIDRAGRIYVGDTAFENVQIFDGEGRLLLAFGQPGDKQQGLNLPAGVAIDYDSVPLFKRYADPRFVLEYVIFVVSQFGPNKVDVFGFGRMGGAVYPADGKADAKSRG